MKLLFPYGQQSSNEQPLSLTLEGFMDSDYAGCPITLHSTSGYVFKLAGATICWKSRKQWSVATSILEAEYMALALATKQYLWLLRGLEELGYPSNLLNHSLSTNNTGADDLVHNPRISDKSKHIQVAYHFTHELVENGTIVVLRIPGLENPVDICTKILLVPKFIYIWNMLMG